MRKPLPHQIRVGVVDHNGELREINIPKDSAQFARDRGWMVWADFEDLMVRPSARSSRTQADGNDDDAEGD